MPCGCSTKAVKNILKNGFDVTVTLKLINAFKIDDHESSLGTVNGSDVNVSSDSFVSDSREPAVAAKTFNLENPAPQRESTPHPRNSNRRMNRRRNESDGIRESAENSNVEPSWDLSWVVTNLTREEISSESVDGSDDGYQPETEATHPSGKRWMKTEPVEYLSDNSDDDYQAETEATPPSEKRWINTEPVEYLSDNSYDDYQPETEATPPSEKRWIKTEPVEYVSPTENISLGRRTKNKKSKRGAGRNQGGNIKVENTVPTEQKNDKPKTECVHRSTHGFFAWIKFSERSKFLPGFVFSDIELGQHWARSVILKGELSRYSFRYHKALASIPDRWKCPRYVRALEKFNQKFGCSHK